MDYIFDTLSYLNILNIEIFVNLIDDVYDEITVL